MCMRVCVAVLSFGSGPMADLLKFADERHKQVGAHLHMYACVVHSGVVVEGVR